MKRRRNGSNVGEQIVQHSKDTTKVATFKPFKGYVEIMISTGSTLLDLAISGGRVRGGGIPSGIFVEIFGPSSAGKTVLLCEIAGDVQRKGGQVRFDDPEARLNKEFAQLFDLNTKDIDYATPDTVTEIFTNIRSWKPKNPDVINGTFTDSLAALSTDIEMDNDEGDKMGQRRAKEFSEGFRKTCRLLMKRNQLMVCSNQVRENQDKANKFSPAFKSTGGFAIGFYASLRLRATEPTDIKVDRDYNGVGFKEVIGVETTFAVHKSSVWKPKRTATISIIFDYGIDDIRDNLQYLKKYKKLTSYQVNGKGLGTSLEKAIVKVEKLGLEKALKNEVIDLWEDIEASIKVERKKKIR